MNKLSEKIRNNELRLKEFISLNKDLEEFVAILLKNINNKEKTIFRIEVNEGLGEECMNFLTTVIENPIIVLGSYKNEPMIFIKSKAITNVGFNLSLISKLSITHSGNNVVSYYKIRFRYNNKIDYAFYISVFKIYDNFTRKYN